MPTRDQFFFPFSRALLMPEQWLCDVESGRGWADWGWALCATLGERSGPSSLERKKYTKIYDSSQPGAHPATSCQSWFSQKLWRGLVEVRVWGGLNCIGEFRQRGQIVSWMATSKAVRPRGGTGGGGRALGPQDGRKSALLFSSGREGGERQEG